MMLVYPQLSAADWRLETMLSFKPSVLFHVALKLAIGMSSPTTKELYTPSLIKILWRSNGSLAFSSDEASMIRVAMYGM
jgi:hypothetical protein